MTNARRWPITLVWLHALLFAAIALASYAAPEIAFGDAAWLPLARLAALLFAAALSAVAVLLVGAALSGNARQVGVALTVALLLDAQAPYLLFSLPASLEYLDRAVGLRWWLLPQTFLILVAVTTYTVVSMWRRRRRLPAVASAAA